MFIVLFRADPLPAVWAFSRRASVCAFVLLLRARAFCHRIPLFHSHSVPGRVFPVSLSLRLILSGVPDVMLLLLAPQTLQAIEFLPDRLALPIQIIRRHPLSTAFLFPRAACN